MKVVAPVSSKAEKPTTVRVGKGGPRAPGAPTNWLAPMNPAQLRQQAVKTITSSYKPPLKELNSQQNRQSAIYNKQVRDNQAFENWYAGQAATITNANNAANQAIMNQMGQATADANAAYAPQAATLTAGADAREGNVSNNAMATPFGQQLTDSQNVDKGIVGSSEQAALQGLHTGTNVLAATNANNEGRVQEGQQKQLANYQTQLASLATERTKLRSSQAGDVQKEIARLQGVEIQKAQAQENYNAAVQKLGLTASIDSQRNAISQQNANTAATRANNEAAQYKSEDALRAAQIKAGLTEAQWRSMQANKSYKLQARKLGDQEATTRYLQTHHLGTYAPKSGSSGAGGGYTFGTQSEQNSIANRIDTIRGEADRLLASGKTPAEVRTILQQGASFKVKNAKTGTSTTSFSPVGNTTLLNAAMALSSTGLGLTPPQIAALNKMGLQVGSRFRRAPKPVYPPATRGKQQAR